MGRAALTTGAAVAALCVTVSCGATTTGSAVGAPPAMHSSSAAPSSAAAPSAGPGGVGGDVPRTPAPKGLTWYSGPVEGVEVAFPSDWYVVELTEPGWRAGVVRRAEGDGVDADGLVRALEAALPGGALFAAVDVPAWRAGPGPLNLVSRAPARGVSLDALEDDLRGRLTSQEVEQLETRRVSNDQGDELLHLTYGIAESNTFQVQFVTLDPSSWAWTIEFSAPDGPALPQQLGMFDEAVATSRIA